MFVKSIKSGRVCNHLLRSLNEKREKKILHIYILLDMNNVILFIIYILFSIK